MLNKQAQQIAEELEKLSSPKEVVNFLVGILTPKEISEIATRLEIVKMLKKGMPQRIIAEKLGVGVATVTRGSRELQRGYFKHV
jgi:TrpR family trp operon transcriptional repressor